MNNIDRDTLEKKYVIERKAIHVVAKEMGVATGTVYNYLKKYGIKTRKKTDYPATEKQREAWRKIGKKKNGMQTERTNKTQDF